MDNKPSWHYSKLCFKDFSVPLKCEKAYFTPVRVAEFRYS